MDSGESASATTHTQWESSDNVTKSGRAQANKRQHPRSKVILSARVSWIGTEVPTPEAGIVLDISAGGLQILLPSTYHFETGENKEDPKLSVSITLQQTDQDLTIQCVPKHMYHSSAGTTIGALFYDTDAACYQTLKKYLIK
jgi:hypothetical protein